MDFMLYHMMKWFWALEYVEFSESLSLSAKQIQNWTKEKSHLVLSHIN